MEKIEESLSRRIKKLEEELKTPDSRIAFLTAFLEEIDFKDLERYDSIDIKKVLVASLICESEYYNNVEELNEIVEKISIPLSILSSDDIDAMLPIFYDLAEGEALKEFKFLLDKHPEERTGLIYAILQSVNPNPGDIEERQRMDFVSMLLADSDELLEFMGEIDKDSVSWHNALSLVAAIKEISERKRHHILNLNGKKNQFPYNQNTSLGQILACEFDISEIMKEVSLFRKTLNNFKRQAKDQEKAHRKEIKDITAILKVLENPPLEIDDYRSWIRSINDENLRIELLKYIYEHNKSYLDKLTSRSQELRSNSILSYQELQQQYNLKNMDTQFLMERYSSEDLRAILESLKELGITDDKSLEEIIKNTSLSTVNSILSLVAEKIISKDLVKENIAVLDAEKNYAQRIRKNKETIEKTTGSNALYKKRDKVLLIDDNSLTKNLNTLKDYDYLSSLATTNNYGFLASEDLEDKLDLILELGFEKALEENLGLLNYSEKTWMRLRILETLNIPVTNQELEAVLHTDNFYVPDDMIGQYLDLEPLESLPVKEEDVVTTPRTYIINGVYFSKRKVERVELPGNEALCKNRLFSSTERERLMASNKINQKN